MSTRIGVISDTHGMLRPEAVKALEGVEHILHAGDIGLNQILEALGKIAPVTAVRGNTDLWEGAGKLPDTNVLDVNGVTIYMLHHLEAIDLDPAAAGFKVVVSGHTHIAKVSQRNGVLYLNPGSAGLKRFLLPVTLAILEVDEEGPKAQIIKL